EAEETLRQVQTSRAEGLALRCDLREESGVQQMIAEVLEAFGAIDILINNAGLFQTAKLEEISVSQWDDLFAVNVRAPFLVSKHCIPHLRSRRGRIINLGSLEALKSWAKHHHCCAAITALHM